MRLLTIREVRASLARLESLLAEEGEIVVAHHSRAVARLLPARPTTPMPSHADLRASMPRLRTKSENLVRNDRRRFQPRLTK